MATQMWFGNVNHAQWVPHPQVGMTRTHTGYSEVIQFDNGGRYVTRTAASSLGYEMNFPVGDATQYLGLEAFERFASGEYGTDYLHFIDPMWADQNIMPEGWASPGLCEQGWKPIYDSAPTNFSDVATNAYTKPLRSATYTIDTDPNEQPIGQNAVCTFLIPPTNTLWFGACGTVSGTAVLRAEAFYITPRVNLVLNPSFEIDLTAWAVAAGGASVRSTVQHQSDTASLQFTANTTTITNTNVSTTVTTVIGQTYTASCYVLNKTGARSAKMTANAVSSSTVVLSGSWQRLSVTFTASSTSTSVVVLFTNTGAVSDAFYLDAVMVELGATLGGYFDGDSTAGGQAVWSGLAGNSTSIARSTPFDTALSAESAAPSLTSSFDGAVYDEVQIYIATTLDPTPTITLTAMWAQCLVTGQSPVITRHLPGHGHMGLMWDGNPRIETYQLGSRHLVGASMSLIEVEPWA